MSKNRYTFLTEEQIFGDDDGNGQLDVFNRGKKAAAITDFSILLGGYVNDYYHIEGESSLKGRTCLYWTKTGYGDNGARAVDENGYSDECGVEARDAGARPALPFSSIETIPTNEVSGRAKIKNGVVEWGYYPQTVASRDMQQKLELALKSRRLVKTGNTYTTDSVDCNAFDTSFQPQKHEEYEYNGKKYVRVKANSCFHGSKFTLSNGEQYQDGDDVWVEVEPVRWIVDEKAKMMIAEKLVFSGVQFNKEINDHIEAFEKTDIFRFLDKEFARDLEQTRTLERGSISGSPTMTRKSRLQKLNPDKTDVSQRRKMTDTELIHDWIESGESVLLRGPSGIGKTERIRKLYPDLIELKLTNNMFPEKVVGSTNLQTGESIPPDFAKQAIMQGATEEERESIKENIQNIYGIANQIYERSRHSDKKQVILLDELLNVKPAVQSLVYTLVLNRFVEVGKGIKLPDNVVIVATGNQKKYSSVAEDLAEPLEKRFYHILDMEPKVGEWLTEYAIPSGIHPSVIGYIMSKYQASGKSEDLKDIGYFYEEPDVGEKHVDRNGCKGNTNDPRGWTEVSDTLKAFEESLKAGKYVGKDVEDILYRRVGTKLRDEWTSEFYDFYNMPTLSPQEVVQGKFTQADLPRDTNERFAYMTALISADESQVESCRKFIREHCDPEYLATFDICWAGNDERRQEKIGELQSMDMMDKTRLKGEDARVYADNGITGYDEIGAMYSKSLQRDTKDKGEQDVRE